MYVLCAGMYRACSTWQYEVIAHLLERHRDGQRLGYLTGDEFAAWDGAHRDEPGTFVLKSHEEGPEFARAVEEGRAVVIYAHRDLRDVVFSLMHKRGQTFDQIVRQGMIHQVLANDRFWTSRPGVLIQRYDDLIADPVAGILAIAAHLKLEVTPDEAAEIAAEYSSQTNRRRTAALVEQLRAAGVDLNDPSNLQYYDQRTLLHWNHLREGRPGNWRTEATPRQRAVCARLCDRWLVAHGYEPTPLEPSAWTLGGEVELARAWLTCTLRCASLRHPGLARTIKPLLGIDPGIPGAVPAKVSANSRVDAAQDQALPLHAAAREPSRHDLHDPE